LIFEWRSAGGSSLTRIIIKKNQPVEWNNNYELQESFAWKNSSLYRKQSCWKILIAEEARTTIKACNQPTLIISQRT